METRIKVPFQICPSLIVKLCKITYLKSLIISCSGIDKCNPTKTEWIGYNEGCCTTSNPCGEGQGGCASTEQCGGGNLICSDSQTSCVNKFNFGSGQKCCHIKGALIRINMNSMVNKSILGNYVASNFDSYHIINMS